VSNSNSEKGQVHRRTVHEGPEEECTCIYTLSLTSALDGRGWLKSRPGRFTPGNDPVQNCIGGWVNPRAGLDWCGKSRALPPPPPGFDHHSESLYQLRYRKSNITRAKHLLLNFNVSPCIFQFNNWWIPTHALFHIQNCINLECWF